MVIVVLNETRFQTNRRFWFIRINKRVVAEFGDAPSSLNVLLKTLDDEVFALCRHGGLRWELNVSHVQNHIFPQQRFLRGTPPPQSYLRHVFSEGFFPVDHLVEDDSDGPDVDLLGDERWGAVAGLEALGR